MFRSFFHSEERRVTFSRLSPHTLLAGKRAPCFGMRIFIARMPFFLEYFGEGIATLSGALWREEPRRSNSCILEVS